MIEVIRGSTRTPVTADELVQTLSEMDGLEGILYIGYPIIGSPEGPLSIDALLLSPRAGIVIFDLVEAREVGDYEERQDQAYRRMQAKLLQYSGLSRKRQLLVDLSTVSFAPSVPAAQYPTHAGLSEESPLVTTKEDLTAYIASLAFELSEEIYRTVVSVIQSVTTIRAGRRKRDTRNGNSRGAIAGRLEQSIANLDAKQSSAVIETYEGVQQIRGLAGSGKTIILALKVAYLHAQHPEWKIAVTFNTRSLKGLLRKFIYTFVVEQTGQEPDFDNVQIVNAWGAPGPDDRDGIYHKFCKQNGVSYLDFGAARRTARVAGISDPFDYACQVALDTPVEEPEYYDAILVDEAQDFWPSFLRLCYKFLKEPKRLVYAYDELQSLSEGEGMPTPEEIFGRDKNGNPLVSFSEPQDPRAAQRDIVLEQCYRNSRPVLVTAHALGFGIYRKGGLVQMFGDPTLWEDIGYRVADGELRDGHKVTLQRTSDTSPLFLEAHSPVDDLIKFVQFESEEEQAQDLVQKIKQNLEADELRPEDIIVINANSMKAREQVALARELLFREGIKSELAGVSTDPDVFFKEDAVIFTGIFRAKGNEAPMVYVLNAQHCLERFRQDLKRNVLFTAITRSKAWVRVFGVGPSMKLLIDEYEKLRSCNFRLEFTYPTEDERRALRIYHRKDSERRRKSIRAQTRTLQQLVIALETGEIELDDVPAELREKLRKALLKGK